MARSDGAAAVAPPSFAVRELPVASTAGAGPGDIERIEEGLVSGGDGDGDGDGRGDGDGDGDGGGDGDGDGGGGDGDGGGGDGDGDGSGDGDDDRDRDRDRDGDGDWAASGVVASLKSPAQRSRC